MNTDAPIKVLIAEDDYMVSEAIKRVIRELEYDLAGKASDGKEAVLMTCKLKPSVVLMDVEMPEMDGLEACNLIQEKCPTPVVILTAYESPEVVKRASEVGAAAYLLKPPNAREIQRAITIAMARHEDLMKLRKLNAELQAALAEIKTLRGIFPICSHCKKIRDDEGYWNRIDLYIREHSDAEFSHGICPECMEKYYSEYAD